MVICWWTLIAVNLEFAFLIRDVFSFLFHSNKMHSVCGLCRAMPLTLSNGHMDFGRIISWGSLSPEEKNEKAIKHNYNINSAVPDVNSYSFRISHRRKVCIVNWAMNMKYICVRCVCKSWYINYYCVCNFRVLQRLSVEAKNKCDVRNPINEIHRPRFNSGMLPIETVNSLAANWTWDAPYLYTM